MKKLLTTLTILNLIVAPVFAQEQSGCFLRDNNGEIQSLRELCPGSEIPISESKKDDSPPPLAPESMDINIPNPNDNNIKKENQSGTFFSVPIKKKVGGIPLIDVTFNGNKTFEMLLDTGATITTITPTMVQELNLKSERTIPVATAGGIIQSGLGKVESIKAGNLQINNLLVSLSSSLPFGLLGQNFYRDYDITIKENLVEFYPRNKK